MFPGLSIAAREKLSAASSPRPSNCATWPTWKGASPVLGRDPLGPPIGGERSFQVAELPAAVAKLDQVGRILRPSLGVLA
jgi:hypothetical protein